MMVSHPLFIHIFAAAILVTIPPLPKLDVWALAICSIVLFILKTSLIFFASLFLLGFLSYNPSTSLSRISKSASIIWATLAANLSLSPYLISSVATVSFSLITGITLFCKSVFIVFLALRYLLLTSLSSSVIRT